MSGSIAGGSPWEMSAEDSFVLASASGTLPQFRHQSLPDDATGRTSDSFGSSVSDEYEEEPAELPAPVVGEDEEEEDDDDDDDEELEQTAETGDYDEELEQTAETGDYDDEAAELDSLPSISTSILSPSDMSTTSSEAQQDWEASLEQLQLMLSMVLVPFIGKYLGRKFAYWSWARYMEYTHNVKVRWTNRREFNTVGVAAAASTL